ncbi:ATP-binding protein [Streptomyces sp. NPDC047315]|uniref:ATP-binding protein n=1 Tax=Streptomyces sp. NPDC047315 TaxID=3155142 RepID=UPI0033D2890C
MGTNGSTMLKPLRQGLPPIDSARAVSSASCSLPGRHEAVRAARQFASATLRDWELQERYDDIALVVSELVTNALRHALPDEPAHETYETYDAPVRLHLMRWPGRLVIAVRDPSPKSPGAHFETDAATVAYDFDTDGFGADGAAPQGLASQGLALLPESCDTAESGRGLFLVDSFSDSWGWHPLAGALHGKVVWALFRLA